MLAMSARVSTTRMSVFRQVQFFFLLAIATLAFSCGSPPDPKPPVAKDKNSVAQVAKRYDLRPAPEPKNIIAWGRVSNPAQLLDVAKEWSSLPMPDSAAITQLLAKEPLGAVIDLTHPVDFVTTLHNEKGNMKMAFVMSASVASLEDALTLARKRHTIRESEPGVFPLGFGPKKHAHKTSTSDDDDEDDEDDDDDDNDISCVIAAALGPSPARFICGNALGITELSAYAARTLPSRPAKEGVHIEVSMQVVNREAQAMALEMLGQDSRKQTSSAWTIGKALLTELDDLSADVPQMEFDILVSRERVTAQSNIAYQSTRSLLAQLWANRAGKAGPVGEAFWRLPKDSTSAFYWGGYDAKLFGRPRALLMDGLRELLDSSPLTPGDRTTVIDYSDRLLGLLTQASAWASGKEAPLKGQTTERRFDAETKARSIIGWQMVVLEDPFATVAPILRNAVQLYARPSFRKSLDLDHKPKNEWDSKSPTFVIAPMPRAVPFAKDAVHAVVTIFTRDVERTVKGGNKPLVKEKATPLHLFAVADGPRTIVAFGFDEVPLANRVKSALSTSPKVGTLAELPSLDFLRDPHVGYGGFTSSARFAFEELARNDDMKKVGETVAQHPIRFLGRTEQTQGPTAGRVTGSIEIDRELIMGVIKLLDRDHERSSED